MSVYQRISWKNANCFVPSNTHVYVGLQSISNGHTGWLLMSNWSKSGQEGGSRETISERDTDKGRMIGASQLWNILK